MNDDFKIVRSIRSIHVYCVDGFDILRCLRFYALVITLKFCRSRRRRLLPRRLHRSSGNLWTRNHPVEEVRIRNPFKVKQIPHR